MKANEVSPRPPTRSDGSPWFLEDDPERYPISQAFEVGPTAKEIDQAKNEEGN